MCQQLLLHLKACCTQQSCIVTCVLFTPCTPTPTSYLIHGLLLGRHRTASCQQEIIILCPQTSPADVPQPQTAFS